MSDLDFDLNAPAAPSLTLDAAPAAPTPPWAPSPTFRRGRWDDYLPAITGNAVQLPTCRSGAFSKYARGGIYG